MRVLEKMLTPAALLRQLWGSLGEARQCILSRHASGSSPTADFVNLRGAPDVKICLCGAAEDAASAALPESALPSEASAEHNMP